MFRWDSKAWVQIRKGAKLGLKGERIQLLTPIPATARTPAMVWARLRNGQGGETLLLCDMAKCTAKVRQAGCVGGMMWTVLQPVTVAAALRDGPCMCSSFLPAILAQKSSPAASGFMAFAASGPNFALVWQLAHSSGISYMALIQHNGTAWRTLEANVVLQSASQREDGSWVVDPVPMTGAASPNCAVAGIAASAFVGMTLITSAWNGVSWTLQTDMPLVEPQLNKPWTLQALHSGSALLSLASGRWRLV